MKNYKKKKILLSLVVLTLLLLVTGCGNKEETTEGGSSKTTNSQTSTKTATELFTTRDLEQTPDLEDAVYYTLESNKDITITKEGIYVVTGSAENASIIVEVGDEEKVQIVLDNATITNDNRPCIYVKNADKVFVTTKNTNTLKVSGTFTADNDTNTDAVIFSKDDLVLNGTGTLNITSTDNGITSKDDLKITGGVINIDCESDALEANNTIAIADGDITINSIAINDGTLTINTKKDGLHAEYDEDDTEGNIYIEGGILTITATDDGIHANSRLQIDGGTITINAREGLEGTYIQINDGTLKITATDDGINAASQSSAYKTPTIEINGGSLTIDMGQGDTDAIDANGNLYINGGTLNITAQSPFDYDGEASYTGGTMIVNGEETTTITNQMMGGGGMGPGGNNGNRGHGGR